MFAHSSLVEMWVERRKFTVGVTGVRFSERAESPITSRVVARTQTVISEHTETAQVRCSSTTQAANTPTTEERVTGSLIKTTLFALLH